MALTGRTALLAALGSLVVGLLLPSWTGIALVSGAVLLGVLADLLLAAPVRTLQLARTGDTAVRLGEPATVTLTVGNASGRPLRARLRDAWPPSVFRPGTELTASRHRLLVPPGERRRIDTPLLPNRRGDHQAHRVTIRSLGPLGLAGRQGSHLVPWTLRALPPFTSRKHLPSRLARLRELDGRTSLLTRGQGTEFDSLREYLPGDDVRSIDWRASARRNTVAVRTWRPERDRHILIVLDTGRTSAAGSATPLGWTPPWTPPCCSPRWPPRRATGSTCSPTTCARAPRWWAAPRARSCPQSPTRWHCWSRPWSRPTCGHSPRRPCGWPRTAR